MRTANPTLNANTFVQFQGTAVRGETMTIQGTVNKTGLLLILLLLAAAHTWNMFFTSGNSAAVMPWMWGGMIGGFVVALITVFKKNWAMLTAPVYAVLEGLFLGALSSILEAQYPGIVVQAVGLTFGTLLALLIAYRSGLIRATENFKLEWRRRQAASFWFTWRRWFWDSSASGYRSFTGAASWASASACSLWSSRR